MGAANDVTKRVHDVAGELRDTVAGAAVYGEPVTNDGVTVIPAARVGGGFGGGGGGGDHEGDAGSGMGFGFGMRARPVGAFVIRDGKVRWKPAVDVTRITIVGCLVAIAYFAAVVLKGGRSEHRA